MACQKCGSVLPAGASFCPHCRTPVALVQPKRVAIPEDIAKRAENFAGREWVLREVVDWLDKGQERFLLLTGEPGCGKTALAAWLAGAGPTPQDVEAAASLERVRDAWHAAHFCMAEDQRGSLDPGRFAQSLARQLSGRNDHYDKAALQRLAPEINISLKARENWGQMVGAQIETLIINGNVEGIYNLAVREPLEVLSKSQPDLHIFILVDALDEALTSRSPNIVTLLAGSGDLPAGVRFLLTSRNDDKVTDQFKGKRRINLSSDEHKNDADFDIRKYVGQRLSAEPLKRPTVTLSRDSVDHLVEQADGNFLYMKFFLDEVAAENRSLIDLAGLPKGLYGLYRTFLDRLMPEMLEIGGSPRWLGHYQPLLGCLSVAVPAAPKSLLHKWLRHSEGEVRFWVTNLFKQLIESDPQDGGGYRLYHRSMAEFLASENYEEDGELRENRYYTPPAEQHRRITAYYLGRALSWEEVVWDQVDNYGLHHLAYHLFEAGQRQELRRILLDYDWLRVKLAAVDIDSLMRDYGYLTDDSYLHLVQGALELSEHVLFQDKKQLAGQLTGRLIGFENPAIQTFLFSCCASA